MKPFSTWTALERDAVLSSFVRHISDSRAKGIPWAYKACAEKAMQSVVDGEVEAVLLGDYVLVFSVGSDWYSHSTLLCEQMLIRVFRRGGTFKDVTRGLDELADIFACDQVVVGNGIGRPGLARLYQGAGFVRANEFYIKEYSWADSKRS